MTISLKSNMSLLFVCLGNICRSPLAEAAFKQEAERLGIPAYIDSAGTGAWHIGEPPDKRAQTVALTKSMDISGYKGRQVTTRDFDVFDYIFALDHNNFNNLKALQPKGSKAQLSLLLDLVPSKKGKAVNDPYYGDNKDFERTWDEVSEAAQCFFKKVVENKL